MEYTVKNVKNFMGREVYGYSCTLYKNGKSIGTVTDTADGGPADLYLKSRELEQELRDFVDTLPSFKFQDMDIPQSVETFIDSLINEYQQANQLAKLTRTNWVYRFKGKESGVLSYFSKKLDKALIEQKFSDQIIECLNDEL